MVASRLVGMQVATSPILIVVFPSLKIFKQNDNLKHQLPFHFQLQAIPDSLLVTVAVRKYDSGYNQA